MNADPVLSYNFDAIEYSVRQEITPPRPVSTLRCKS